MEKTAEDSVTWSGWHNLSALRSAPGELLQFLEGEARVVEVPQRVHVVALQDPPFAFHELAEVEQQLAAHPPDSVVWNHERPDLRPPWGDNIAPHITSLANYFWTSDGRPLLTVLRTALKAAEQRQEDVLVR